MSWTNSKQCSRSSPENVNGAWIVNDHYEMQIRNKLHDITNIEGSVQDLKEFNYQLGGCDLHVQSSSSEPNSSVQSSVHIGLHRDE